MNIELQVLGHALRGVAEEMGAALVRSAFSANIKERRDCSTALFDENGRMVAQAEHIPVHLGAMPDAVAAVMSHNPGRNDVFILNDPFAGGTHLPDITLVSRTDVGFAVTRAHHADVGGVEPGSMPAASRTLEEEGVVIAPTRLGPETLDALAARMRNPDERMGDFRAQLAAHRLADERVAELCSRHGPDGVRAAMDELLAYSERIVRTGIARLPDGRFEASDVLEAIEGTLTIRVAVTVAGDELEVDFAGTDSQHDGNLNCPLSVTRSAAYFVVRCLTAPDVPASAGAFAPVTVVAPQGSLVNALPGAAVAGGNVETSCRIVDVLFRALRPGCCRACPGAGDDEQPHARQRPVHVLRDDRRRAGRVPGRRRPERRPRDDVEHADDTGRGARARVSAASSAPRAAARLGRRGPAPRRRRRRARAGGARGLPRSRSSPSAAPTHPREPRAEARQNRAATS